METTLYGVRAIQVVKKSPCPDDASDALKAKYAMSPPDGEHEVVRIMTGRSTGVWVPLKHLSGDCLTNVNTDAEGVVRAFIDSPRPGFKDLEIFTFTINLEEKVK